MEERKVNNNLTAIFLQNKYLRDFYLNRKSCIIRVSFNADVTELAQKLSKLEAQMAAKISSDELDKVMKTYAKLQDQFMGMNGYEKI